MEKDQSIGTVSDSERLETNNFSDNENYNGNDDSKNIQRQSSASSDSGSAVLLRSRISNLFRPGSFIKRVRSRRSKSPFLEKSRVSDNYEKALVPVGDEKLFTKEPKSWTTIVTVVLVEAKGLPDPPNDGLSHNVYCKIRLGSETQKTKLVPNTTQPKWRERFDLRLYQDNFLKLTLWDKGKQKNFMGSGVLDLSTLERERTHEIWQQLDDGFGTVHLSVTMCDVRNKEVIPNGSPNFDEEEVRSKIAISDLKNDWNLVGQLHVKVIGARGLSGKTKAYCTLELDNERVQTHSSRSSSEPLWNKSYIFNVYDVTSTLDLKVYDSSIVKALRNESLGRVSIPLLKIHNGEPQWYALKNRTKRSSARGNCPRVQLEMTMLWNPVKATARLFQPKAVKYLKKPPKFDVALVYSNMEFIRDTFNALFEINEHFKRLFEWENQELSFTVLVCWLVFWYYFRMWATPLLLLLPFLYFWFSQPYQQDKFTRSPAAEDNSETQDSEKEDKSWFLAGKIQGLPEMTLTITGGVEYTVSIAERLYNLASFKVPFLSFLAMIFLTVSAFAFYFIPFNYMMMAFALYKFTRKYLNPGRTLNNDLLDFLSRVPDNVILKDWKELNVPEPSLRRQTKEKTTEA